MLINDSLELESIPSCSLQATAAVSRCGGRFNNPIKSDLARGDFHFLCIPLSLKACAVYILESVGFVGPALLQSESDSEGDASELEYLCVEAIYAICV